MHMCTHLQANVVKNIISKLTIFLQIEKKNYFLITFFHLF